MACWDYKTGPPETEIQNHDLLFSFFEGIESEILRLFDKTTYCFSAFFESTGLRES